MSESSLVILARAPEPGRVKTRLAATLGPAGALAVYRQLLACTAAVAQAWPGPVLLAATGEGWRDSGLEHLPRQAQPPGSLGARIAAALRWGLARAPRTVAIGTDCPGLDVAALLALVQGLDEAPVAYGPAADGGYWGVAVRDGAPLGPMTADDLPWSQPDLLTASRRRLLAAGCASTLGATLADCDDADDLAAAVRAGLLTWPSHLEILQ